MGRLTIFALHFYQKLGETNNISEWRKPGEKKPITFRKYKPFDGDESRPNYGWHFISENENLPLFNGFGGISDFRKIFQSGN